jgi:CRP/FNR family transcriptional regulator
MRSPYGLDIIDSCLTCDLREERLFCNLSSDAVKSLESIKSTAAYPKGAVLFVEGQTARGVFVLCNGKAKLTTTSADGKTLILKIADPGEVLGLSATVSGKAYEVTAEVVDFLAFLRRHGEAALRVAQQLSSNYHTAYEEIRSLGLSSSASEKLAKLLLEWATQHDNGKPTPEVRLKMTLTHEEIGQMIGSSRETVTRLFADFKKRQLIQVKGSTLLIRNRGALEKLVNS